MAKRDPQISPHLEWIGFVRPTGLVVSAPALVRAGAILDRRDTEGQRLLSTCVAERTFDAKKGPVPYLPDFRVFAESVLGWSFSPKAYAGSVEHPIPSELELPLPNYGETLRPDLAVRELEPKDGAPSWQLLVQILEPGQDFDRLFRGDGHLEASPHSRMERLLRHTQVPAGLLFNGRTLRLVSAPRGESSGWIDFRVEDMVQTAGRPISTALRLLLGQRRLLSLPRTQRLAALLEDSRKFQNEVSERLAEQVLHALYELLRGFQAAHDASKGELLRQPLAEHPDEIYRALLTVILRLVFLLFAEERDMLPENEIFLQYYSLSGLHERLQEDAALFPDTMDQRYGAWAQLLVLFRMIHDGAELGATRLPRRHGVLFDPDRFKFLEGRSSGGARQTDERIEPPLVPDGTIFRALDKLLVLDGERISYRALDVEQIGSVYETMMGFRLETATGRSVAIKADKKQGAPTTIDLEQLLGEPAAKRDKWIQERADRKLTDTVKKATAEAEKLEDLHAALLPVIDFAATPDLVSKGAIVLQPSEERRRSGSHYTPRALTEPIVGKALDSILTRLRGADGRPPRPAQILDLKVCDPAMGSGAFLVETCRQLGDALVEAWRAHDEMPALPSDEDEVIFARRLIAQRCLYGVDKNPVAVDLAKMSLWLVTLAKDHPLTFVDHALRHGDSLVGLSRSQIQGLSWQPQAVIESVRAQEHIATIAELRRRIREADETVSDRERRDLWDETQFEMARIRLLGDLVVAAFFQGEKPKEREAKLGEYANAILTDSADRYRTWLREWRQSERPLLPFHWEIEFPEVFERENSGFDAIVGNPPFMAGSNISSSLGYPYLHWLVQQHDGTHGNGDLVAHFFRRAFNLLRERGAFGLIATKTIGQGDTRTTGLRWICQHDGEIFAAQKRVKWPGLAAVTVSIVHVMKGAFHGTKMLDFHPVKMITAFLFYRGSHDSPARLATNAGKSFVGSYVLGMGFTFDDNDVKGVASPLAEMQRLIAKDPRNQEVIFPYIGGEEITTSPSHAYHRYVINFGERTEEECWRCWPDLMAIVEAKVKPERMKKNRDIRKKFWWRFGETTPALFDAIAGMKRVLVAPRTSKQVALVFLDRGMVYSENTVEFTFDGFGPFAMLQSSVHDIWVRFTSSTLEDRIGYRPSDCFETFPFPKNWEADPTLDAAGKTYYQFRATIMIKNNEGLTKTYNRFHDPCEVDSEVLALRELHAEMDRAMLAAYGWNDIKPHCDFLLDYEIDEEEWGDKKKPWRYRWPDEIRDEVLARLLDLNAERAKEEEYSGATAKKRIGKKAKPSPTPQQTERLFS
jgi:Eco57I restriction-modification methylase/restriction-modification enzyme MmeI-like protein